jgi:Protein of unknown function (DUF1501)
MTRQIFFCSLGGFDNHTNQINMGAPASGTHAGLLLQVSNAMKAFYDAIVQLGIDRQVTTFTLSDFSRTWVPNGTLGTDHAWGSHQFVMAVPCSVAISTVYPVLTAPFSRHSRLMARMIQTREVAHGPLDTNGRDRPVRRYARLLDWCIEHRPCRGISKYRKIWAHPTWASSLSSEKRGMKGPILVGEPWHNLSCKLVLIRQAHRIGRRRFSSGIESTYSVTSF